MEFWPEPIDPDQKFGPPDVIALAIGLGGLLCVIIYFAWCA